MRSLLSRNDRRTYGKLIKDATVGMARKAFTGRFPQSVPDSLSFAPCEKWKAGRSRRMVFRGFYDDSSDIFSGMCVCTLIVIPFIPSLSFSLDVIVQKLLSTAFRRTTAYSSFTWFLISENFEDVCENGEKALAAAYFANRSAPFSL